MRRGIASSERDFSIHKMYLIHFLNGFKIKLAGDEWIMRQKFEAIQFSNSFYLYKVLYNTIHKKEHLLLNNKKQKKKI